MSNRDDNKFNFVIVTGMSGAGKSQACRFMEDLDYFVVDNQCVGQIYGNRLYRFCRKRTLYSRF